MVKILYTPLYDHEEITHRYKVFHLFVTLLTTVKIKINDLKLINGC